MRNMKMGVFIVLLAALLVVAAAMWASRREAPGNSAAPISFTTMSSQSEQEEIAGAQTTAYGYDRDQLDLGEWRISREVKNAIEGEGGCAAMHDRDGAYVPVAFNDGARCAIVRKENATVVYGVGYRSSYEGLGLLGAALYVFKDEGFSLIMDTQGLPKLNEFTADHREALENFAKTHQTDFGAPDWNAYDALSRSYLRKELATPSPRVAEAMKKLKERAEALAP